MAQCLTLEFAASSVTSSRVVALREKLAGRQPHLARLDAHLGDARASAHVDASEARAVLDEREQRLVADAAAPERLERAEPRAASGEPLDTVVCDAGTRVQLQHLEVRTAGGEGAHASVGHEGAACDVKLAQRENRLRRAPPPAPPPPRALPCSPSREVREVSGRERRTRADSRPDLWDVEAI